MEMAKERNIGKKKMDELQKYRKDLADAVQHHEFKTLADKERDAQLEQAHLRYIAQSKSRQDYEQDKYYKFYQDFNQKMEDRVKEYDEFNRPKQLKAVEDQRRAEQDLQKREYEDRQ